MAEIEVRKLLMIAFICITKGITEPCKDNFVAINCSNSYKADTKCFECCGLENKDCNVQIICLCKKTNTSFKCPANICNYKNPSTDKCKYFTEEQMSTCTDGKQTSSENSSNISVSLIVGISIISVLAGVGVFAVGVLVWRRCHASKSASSSPQTADTSNIASNELALGILQSRPKENNYDQIVIDDNQNPSYTPLSIISDESTAIASHATDQCDEANKKSLPKFRQDATQLKDAKHENKIGFNHLPNEKSSLQSGNLALCKTGNGNVDYVDETQNPNNGSIYFELDILDEHHEDTFSNDSNTGILLTSPKNSIIFSNLNRENMEAESHIQIPNEKAAVNNACQQSYGDLSTYFELEKHDGDDENNTTESDSMTTDQYSKLREVSRNFGDDYNDLSTLDKSLTYELAHISDTVVPETITSSSNYSLAQIPIITSDG